MRNIMHVAVLYHVRYAHWILKFIQVAMKNKTTLLVDDLSKFPMCTKNEDVLNFNFCYYVGAPCFVGNLRGKSSVKQL